MSLRYIRIALFTTQTGWTEKAVRRKIEDGVWVQGREYRKAPDGALLIDTEAFRPAAVAELPEPKLRVARTGHIYFIQAAISGSIKIGFSKAPLARLSGLQTSIPDDLTLLGTTPGGISDEAALHRKFAPFRQRGEWFVPAPELLEFIGRLAA